MRKILSIVAVIALIVALSVPAFAATPSIVFAGDSVTTDTTIETENGTLTVEVTEAEMAEKEETSLPDAVEAAVQEAIDAGDAAEGTEASAVEVVNVDLVDEAGNVVSEEYFENGGSLKVAFARDDTTQEVVAVLYWNDATQAWDSAAFEVGEDGSIVATFEHLCTVAFVLKKIERDPEPGGETGGEQPAPGPKDPSKSPQTGYNVLGWAIAATALVLAAGCCFVGVRKVTE